MEKKFRQSKYLNESGSKQGNWYLNRLDYFQFYSYPRDKLHQLLTLVVGITAYFLSIKLISQSFLLTLLCWYLGYVALWTFYLLRRKICRYRGYLFYPKRLVAFFYAIRVDVDLQDFDSAATLNK